METLRPSDVHPPSRTLWLYALGLVAAAAMSGAALHALGQARRVIGVARPASVPGLDALLVRRNTAVLDAWRERGFRGRIVVHVGRFLHFLGEEPRPGARSYLRVAAETGIARRILYLSPPGTLEARLRTLGVDRASLPLALPSQVFPRVLYDKLPDVDEPVLLDVNASFFDEGTAAGLLDALRRSRLRIDLVTLSVAEDADDVSDRARAGLRQFAAALAGTAREERP